VFFSVLEPAFAAVGHTMEPGLLPAERSLRLLSAGVEDGDGPRIEQMDTLYPELRRVPEPLLDYRFVALARPGTLRVDGWESLDGRHVAIVRGWKILERNLGGAGSLQAVRTPELLFGLLARDRAEAVIFEESMGIGLLEAQGDAGEFAALSPALAVRPMYLFLNSRHEELLEPLAEALRTLKSSGEGRRRIIEVLDGRPLSDFPGLNRHWGPMQ